MKSIEEFKKDPKNFIIFEEKQDYLDFLKIFNPRFLRESLFDDYNIITVDGDGCWSNDVEYMRNHYKFYCYYSELKNYEIY